MEQERSNDNNNHSGSNNKTDTAASTVTHIILPKMWEEQLPLWSTYKQMGDLSKDQRTGTGSAAGCRQAISLLASQPRADVEVACPIVHSFKCSMHSTTELFFVYL